LRALVADTHALVWHLSAPQRLGKQARRLLESADAGRAVAHVPAICLVEVALLHQRGRLRFGCDRVIADLAPHPGWQVLALDIEQALAFAALASIRDPMDRLVAAAARVLDATLVSADPAFDVTGLRRAWD
jgi:PIN domain nuclease of toxin-antitoxin system